MTEHCKTDGCFFSVYDEQGHCALHTTTTCIFGSSLEGWKHFPDMSNYSPCRALTEGSVNRALCPKHICEVKGCHKCISREQDKYKRCHDHLCPFDLGKRRCNGRPITDVIGERCQDHHCPKCEPSDPESEENLFLEYMSLDSLYCLKHGNKEDEEPEIEPSMIKRKVLLAQVE